MMSNKSPRYLEVVLILFQLSFCIHGRSVSVLHFGDFMEFQVGLNTACANVTGGQTVIEEISSSFGECTQPFKKGKSDPDNGKIDKFCKNREEYFQCWNNLKLEILKKCGNDKEKMLPALYHTTLVAYCEHDSGAKQQEGLEMAMETPKQINKQCASLTGKHWLETCKDLLPDFTSPNLCKRHEVIEKCLGIYLCDNYLNASWTRQKYLDERSILQCEK